MLEYHLPRLWNRRCPGAHKDWNKPQEVQGGMAHQHLGHTCAWSANAAQPRHLLGSSSPEDHTASVQRESCHDCTTWQLKLAVELSSVMMLISMTPCVNARCATQIHQPDLCKVMDTQCSALMMSWTRHGFLAVYAAWRQPAALQSKED